MQMVTCSKRKGCLRRTWTLSFATIEANLPKIIPEIGADRRLYSADYPHGDRTSGSVGLLRTRDDVSATAKNQILETNARKFYGL